MQVCSADMTESNCVASVFIELISVSRLLLSFCKSIKAWSLKFLYWLRRRFILFQTASLLLIFDNMLFFKVSAVFFSPSSAVRASLACCSVYEEGRELLMLSRFFSRERWKAAQFDEKVKLLISVLQSSSILVISVLLSDEWLTNGTLQYASMASFV